MVFLRKVPFILGFLAPITMICIPKQTASSKYEVPIKNLLFRKNPNNETKILVADKEKTPNAQTKLTSENNQNETQELELPRKNETGLTTITESENTPTSLKPENYQKDSVDIKMEFPEVNKNPLEPTQQEKPIPSSSAPENKDQKTNQTQNPKRRKGRVVDLTKPGWTFEDLVATIEHYTGEDIAPNREKYTWTDVVW